ncbi:MAG: methyltransferase domain-containing protein, partial [Kiritimatiellae bacterium]|nr:methyltransferase domain-containing protein [Kiritimatiellia bacterium]
ETSNADYATRFAGATGAWMLSVQARLTRRLLTSAPARGTLLDVGGGHGQLATPLADDGWQVTVLGSAPVCRERVATLVETGRCAFKVGNVVALPFEDRSFDAVICFRLLTHCERWPKLVAELCRVSRGPVIVDYPTSQSINAVAPALFAAKKKIERNTRTWRLFKHREVTAAFTAAGYRIVARRKQFALPMVLHRALKCAPLSAALEGACRACGLTALAGSPVIVRAERERDITIR